MFKQKKLSLGARFGLQVASFILGIMLFFSAIATVLVADLQIVISADGIQGLVRTVMSAPARVRTNAPISVSGEGALRIAPKTRTYQTPRLEEPGDVAAGLTDQVIGMFYEALGDQFQEVLPVSQEEFTQLINESTVKDYIADKTAGLITDYFNDEITTTFEAEEVVQLIEENSELIESITGQPIPNDIAQQVGQIFDENEIVQVLEVEGLAGFMKLTAGEGETAPEGLPGASSDTPDLRFVFKYIQKEIAPTRNLILGIVTCVVLMAAIILINCRQLGKGLRRVGYPLIFAGSIHFLLNGLTDALSGILNSLAGGDAAIAQFVNLVPKLIRYILDKTAGVSIAVFVIGVAMFVGGIVLSIVLRPKKESPVSVATTTETEELVAEIVDETPVEVLPAPEEAAEEATEEEAVAEAEEAAEDEEATEEVAEVTEEETAEEEPAPIGE